MYALVPRYDLYVPSRRAIIAGMLPVNIHMQCEHIEIFGRPLVKVVLTQNFSVSFEHINVENFLHSTKFRPWKIFSF